MVGLVAVLSACTTSTTKAPLDDDFTGLDEKADSFSYRMKVLGSLDYGQTSSTLKYTSSPLYRAYKFAGKPGDVVDVWVRSADGDAVAWVLDNGFHVLGSNDDADDTTFDAHVSLTLPASNSDTHYIVFRDYWKATAKYTVEIAQPYDLSCVHDDDCAAVKEGGCCPDGTLVAVNTSSIDDYANATVCTPQPGTLCPNHMILDTRVAECNANKCGMVAIPDIACGAHSVNSHGCPDGYSCNAPGTDAAGHCVPNE